MTTSTAATEHTDDTKKVQPESATVASFAVRGAGSRKLNKCRLCGQTWERTSSANHRPGCANTDSEK